MAQHPKIFDKLYTNLIRAGETAGALETILRRLAEFREKAQKLKRKVVGALIYPVAVLTIAVLILTFIMIVIVPQFEAIFADLNVTLPAITVYLIDFSNFIGSYWWVMLGMIIGGIFGVKMAKRTEKGGGFGTFMLRLPVLGMVVRKGSVARFTRTLGTLVTSGVGFLDA